MKSFTSVSAVTLVAFCLLSPAAIKRLISSSVMMVFLLGYLAAVLPPTGEMIACLAVNGDERLLEKAGGNDVDRKG